MCVMIKVDLSQAKTVASLLKAPAMNKKTIGAVMAAMPGAVIGTVAASDTLTISKSKEKSDSSPCAFWECTL